VTTFALADDAVNSFKILNGSVITDKIAEHAVTTSKLEDLSVTTDKLVDASVTGAKISSTIAGSKTFSDSLVCSSTISAQAYLALSDATLKKNVSPIGSASEIVQALEPVAYEFIASPGVKFGLIAQDVLKLLPNVVNVGETLSVDYISVFIMLLKSHQELASRVAHLESLQ
jgi:hypothetical protein